MLENLDQQLLLFLNSANSPFWDKIMWVISLKLVWAPLYLAILIYIGLKYKRKFWVIVLFIIAAVVLTDQTSNLFKHGFQRLRPCHEPSLEGLVHLVNGYCAGRYGFVSGHAANSFNVALLSLMFIKKRWFSISIVIWAAVVGYSRIYLGVHYPGDVLCGSILGIIIGYGIYKLYELADRNILQHKEYFNSSSPPPVEE